MIHGAPLLRCMAELTERSLTSISRPCTHACLVGQRNPSAACKAVCGHCPCERWREHRRNVSSFESPPYCPPGYSLVACLRISSFVWKVEWSPKYHQSMFIGIAALVLGTSLATGEICRGSVAHAHP